ncbi:MAG: HAMP domain-containing sensor histidine kinase [Pseudomonadota bacterium]
MRDVLRSGLARAALVSALGFVVAAMAIVQSVVWFNLARVEAERSEELDAAIAELLEVRELEGEDALIEFLGLEDDDAMDFDEALFRLEEGYLVTLLTDETGERVMGFEGLERLREGWQAVPFEEGDDIEVMLVVTSLDDGATLNFARARSDEYFHWMESRDAAFFWLWVVGVPLSLLLAVVVSRSAVRRLDKLSGALRGIGVSNLRQRAPVSARQDEFDRLAQATNAMLDRIEALHAKLETASIGMAHDLKTPVSRISNRLQLMRQDIDDRRALAQHLDAAQAQIESVAQTFQSLLRLGEIESGVRRAQFQHVDMSALVQDVCESFEPVFSDRARRLDVSIVAGVNLQGDADLLTHMLSNLLENSIEYGTPGGNTWVRLQASPRGCLLQVGDDGPGIPAEDQPFVFDRFYRGDGSRSAPGNGLGLSIAKAVCELHDGRLLLLPDQQGAVFDCDFPAGPA